MRNQQSPLPPPPPSPTEVNDLPLPPTQVVDPARSVVDPDKWLEHGQEERERTSLRHTFILYKQSSKLTSSSV
ncbi:hypothetical protein J6590_107819 [Homalodisca vitripennis]|nr:hypothetical protein J6590_107819 [Homalodisca vitripennis]